MTFRPDFTLLRRLACSAMLLCTALAATPQTAGAAPAVVGIERVTEGPSEAEILRAVQEQMLPRFELRSIEVLRSEIQPTAFGNLSVTPVRVTLATPAAFFVQVGMVDGVPVMRQTLPAGGTAEVFGIVEAHLAGQGWAAQFVWDDWDDRERLGDLGGPLRTTHASVIEGSQAHDDLLARKAAADAALIGGMAGTWQGMLRCNRSLYYMDALDIRADGSGGAMWWQAVSLEGSEPVYTALSGELNPARKTLQLRGMERPAEVRAIEGGLEFRYSNSDCEPVVMHRRDEAPEDWVAGRRNTELLASRMESGAVYTAAIWHHGEEMPGKVEMHEAADGFYHFTLHHRMNLGSRLHDQQEAATEYRVRVAPSGAHVIGSWELHGRGDPLPPARCTTRISATEAGALKIRTEGGYMCGTSILIGG